MHRVVVDSTCDRVHKRIVHLASTVDLACYGADGVLMFLACDDVHKRTVAKSCNGVHGRTVELLCSCVKDQLIDWPIPCNGVRRRAVNIACSGVHRVVAQRIDRSINGPACCK